MSSFLLRLLGVMFPCQSKRHVPMPIKEMLDHLLSGDVSESSEAIAQGFNADLVNGSLNLLLSAVCARLHGHHTQRSSTWFQSNKQICACVALTGMIGLAPGLCGMRNGATAMALQVAAIMVRARCPWRPPPFPVSVEAAFLFVHEHCTEHHVCGIFFNLT